MIFWATGRQTVTVRVCDSTGNERREIGLLQCPDDIFPDDPVAFQ